MKKDEFRIRDPFVLTDFKTKQYYLYGTTDFGEEGCRSAKRFSVYTSADLENFNGPFPVFDGEALHFWATMDYWAAEVHYYKGAYYLLGSFKSKERHRGTQILKADSPLGPFLPISEYPQTPLDWECLDGTLYIEEEIPYLVFCHEWTQCCDGEIWAVELTEDLSAAKGVPFKLFSATESPYVSHFKNKAGEKCYVTDGPFLFRENGKTILIWSSFSKGKYVVLQAEADSLHGAWEHCPSKFQFDGGHAMVFTDFNGNRRMSLHNPNIPSKERVVFLPVCPQK